MTEGGERKEGCEGGRREVGRLRGRMFKIFSDDTKA